jgi:hypothetical protein
MSNRLMAAGIWQAKALNGVDPVASANDEWPGAGCRNARHPERVVS